MANMTAVTAPEAKPHHEWTEGSADSNVAHMASLAATYVPGSDEEKRFLRKIDMRIVVSAAVVLVTTMGRARR
jgi:hypothetical protein